MIRIRFAIKRRMEDIKKKKPNLLFFILSPKKILYATLYGWLSCLSRCFGKSSHMYHLFFATKNLIRLDEVVVGRIWSIANEKCEQSIDLFYPINFTAQTLLGLQIAKLVQQWQSRQYQHSSTIAVQVIYQSNINTLINNKQEQSIKRLLLFYYKPMLNAISNKPIK